MTTGAETPRCEKLMATQMGSRRCRRAAVYRITPSVTLGRAWIGCKAHGDELKPHPEWAVVEPLEA